MQDLKIKVCSEEIGSGVEAGDRRAAKIGE